MPVFARIHMHRDPTPRQQTTHDTYHTQIWFPLWNNRVSVDTVAFSYVRVVSHHEVRFWDEGGGGDVYLYGGPYLPMDTRPSKVLLLLRISPLFYQYTRTHTN